MRVLRHGALDARSRCRRTIYFAGGGDSFGFFGRFLRALAPGKKLYQRRFAFQFALTLDAAYQATDFFVGQRFVGKPDVEFLVEVRLIVFFQLAHFEHELQVDHGTTAFETGHGLVVSLHEEFGTLLQALNSPNGFVNTWVRQPGTYRLTDETYAKVLDRTSGKPVSDALRRDLIAYYADLEDSFATKKDPAAWQKVLNELDRLKATPTAGVPKQ
jgi:hypothetical protein